MTETSTPVERRFIERMGQMAQDSGITRVAGQIWAALVLSDQPLSARQLMDLLQISKGSISTNVRLLELLDIVERRSLPGERQDYLALRATPYTSLIEAQIKRFEKSEAMVDEALADIRGEAAREKLADLGTFYSLYRQSSIDMLRAMTSRKS